MEAASKPADEESAEAAAVEPEEDDDEGIDDDDLTVASVEPAHGRRNGGSGFNGPTAFASISLGMSRCGCEADRPRLPWDRTDL